MAPMSFPLKAYPCGSENALGVHPVACPWGPENNKILILLVFLTGSSS